MKTTHKHPLFLLFILALTACSTGQSSFKRGNYYDATMKAVNHLRMKPDSKKSLSTIQKSYPMALSYYRQKVDEYTHSNNPNKYMKIEEVYNSLNTLADEISRCPAAIESVRPIVYFNEQQKRAEELAIEEQYTIALNLLKTGLVKDARLAYTRLEWVKKRRPLYSNINQQLAIAMDLATFKVVIEHHDEEHENYDINSDPFYLRLFDQLNKNNNRKFVRFYKPELAQELKITPHQIVNIQFNEFSVGTFVDRERENNYLSDSIVVGDYTDNKGNTYDVLGVVKASTIIYEQELPARSLLSISIVDFRTNKVIQNQKFPSEYIWENSWATFNGDERAVPNTIVPLLKNTQITPPTPQEMFLLSSEPLIGDATSFLKSYYKRK